MIRIRIVLFILPFSLIVGTIDSYSQVTINEVCPRNANIITDEDGDYPDFIELYNAGSTAVNLQGYSIGDDLDSLSMWTFPSVTIAAQSYLTVFASGKDRKTSIDHWESVVKDTYMWRYIVPTAPVDPAWNTIGFDDSSWLLGAGGIGYGDGDDGTVLSPPIRSVFIRHTFNIVDTALLADAVFHMDYDDSFVAYLNGVEVIRANVGVNGTPTPYDSAAYVEHEALLYQGQLPDEFKITEGQLKSVVINGNNVLCIQVHNTNIFSSDLTARPFISVGIKDNSSSYDVLPFWFVPGASYLHTNFKLSGDGESVYLLDPAQAVIDQVPFPYLQVDHSYGSFPDGSSNYVLFGVPTPNATNNGSITYVGYVDDPVFSLAGGFYPFNQVLTITDTFPGAQIRITMDGSVPDATDPLYSVPISVDSSMVIRARAFAVGYLPSEIITKSYFIDETSTLPVLSITTDPDNLWDWNTGIYVLGPNADPGVPFFGANFWQDWEIPIHMEYYSANEIIQFDQDFGMKIHGGWSRSSPQKSLRILAKSRYGKSTLDYQLFPDKEIYSFKRFILRTSGNETAASGTFFRDALMHKAVETTFNDYQDHRPSIVYLNGEFWGIYNIREKIGRYYLAENFGVDPDSVDLLQFDGAIMEGSNIDFMNLSTFIIANNMAIQANYDVVTAQLDIENFCDHFITQTYYVNWDWPQNNIKYWKSQRPGSKWRYIVTDMDFGLGMGGSPNSNDLNRVLTQSNTTHAYMLNSLLQNTTFKNYFINRYADLINTVFDSTILKDLAYSYRDSIIGEMPRHMLRWGGDMNVWLQLNIDASLISFIVGRNAPARDHIEQVFSLNKQVSVTLNAFPEGAGTIKISTITPDSLPWAGIYFDGVPVTLTAYPNPGYEFSFWQSINLLQTPDYNQSITLNIDTNESFTAYFFGEPDTNRITISEINHKSIVNWNSGDWIELHNYGTVDVDISGWTFKDTNNSNSFTIPDSTVLVQDEYLVLCEDTMQFRLYNPAVSNYVGPFNFGLKSTGENLRLFDENGQLYLSLTFTGDSLWPPAANGLGSTMELLDPYNDMNSSYNWFEGCFGGSPGSAFTPCLVGLQEQNHGSGVAMEAYPNPFDHSTTIRFSMDKSEHVQLRVIDMFGKEVTVLLDETMTKGQHYMQFEPVDLASGIYYCQLITPSSTNYSVISYLGKE